MALFIKDSGDTYDSMKWDFPEHDIKPIIIGKYPYKARTKKNAEILARLREQIDVLCSNLEFHREEWQYSTDNRQYLAGVEVFLGLHHELFYQDISKLPNPFYNIAKKGLKTSRYLLSEMPKGTPFSGLNKPKMRYSDPSASIVGKDVNDRALYRDIFVDLVHNDTPIKLKNLIIHELAHSMANHIRWRPDDHHRDFKWAENLIKEYWPAS